MKHTTAHTARFLKGLLIALLAVQTLSFSAFTVEALAWGTPPPPPPPAYLDDGNEPPANPYLADSPWPMTHRGPYNQASSPWAGLDENDSIDVDYIFGTPGAITLAYGNANGAGDRSFWANTPFYAAKVDPRGEELAYIDQSSSDLSLDALSGAYTVLDKNGVFYAPQGTKLRAFTDATSGKPFSGIVKIAEFQLPASALASSSDSLVGLNMTWDGKLAFATAEGIVGIINRNFTGLQTIALGEGEEVSNSIAVDEDGGIYVVTSKHMHRVQWDGSSLSIAWTADYEVGPEEQVGGRLGAGSGATPSLMGTGNQDKFVVITDGEALMNLVLFWRDEIPADWQPIAPGKDRRIAAEVPVTFGDPSATTSVSEQSVLVRGYGAMVVNNDYGFDLPKWLPDLFNQLLVALTNLPEYAPYGAEKFVWNPATRKLNSAWANPSVSCPNGIPTMSTATNLAYCIGQRSTKWTLEGIDWDTGASVFHKNLGYLPRYNSAYAATEIGPNREIVSGTFTGIIRLQPE
ncbi:MAG: hypothetical protein KDH09_16000 [Chrysiogenetes bacterium]|nr:hypothetical protein [Chrysiogenetes bacterium]